VNNLSIVCVYNDKDILSNWLRKSLECQNFEYESIFLDNTSNKYQSAAEALNEGGTKAHGKYLMFVHQDIKFMNDVFLKDIFHELESIKNLGVAGTAGKSLEDKEIITNIKHGIPPRYASRKHYTCRQEAQTLDESLLVIPREIFRLYQFNEKICDNWHLYGVEYCLSMRKIGFDVYVIPLTLYHKSNGVSLNWSYFITLKKVLHLYKKEYSKICTTVYNWYTGIPIEIQLVPFFFKHLWEFFYFRISDELNNYPRLAKCLFVIKKRVVGR